MILPVRRTATPPRRCATRSRSARTAPAGAAAPPSPSPPPAAFRRPGDRGALPGRLPGVGEMRRERGAGACQNGLCRLRRPGLASTPARGARRYLQMGADPPKGKNVVVTPWAAAIHLGGGLARHSRPPSASCSRLRFLLSGASLAPHFENGVREVAVGADPAQTNLGFVQGQADRPCTNPIRLGDFQTRRFSLDSRPSPRPVISSSLLLQNRSGLSPPSPFLPPPRSRRCICTRSTTLCASWA